jgi:molybdopterin molybdotransferase
VIQEDVRREGDIAIIEKDPGEERYIRRHGSDFQEGDVLLPRGRLLDPRAIVAAAGADVQWLQVFRQPRLRIIGTGDELAEPGTARHRPEAVPESLSLGIAALAQQYGAAVLDRLRLRDDLETMRDAAPGAVQDANIVVVTGGASVGERDFAKAMFEPLGLQLIFSKLAIKPGKPAWFGHVGERLVMGLPGNPTSALVTARLLLLPLLARLQGSAIESVLDWKMAKLASRLGPCGGRETFHRARLHNGKAEVLSFQDSGAQKSLAEADVLVRQPSNSPGIDAGGMVQILDF